MAYLTVNKDGKEVRFNGRKPVRFCDKWVHIENCHDGFLYIDGTVIPFGTIIAMTGQKLTWNDEPIEI